MDSITGITSMQADQLPRAGTTTSTATWSSEIRKSDACPESASAWWSEDPASSTSGAGPASPAAVRW